MCIRDRWLPVSVYYYIPDLLLIVLTIIHKGRKSLSRDKGKFLAATLIETKIQIYVSHTPVSYTHLDVYKRQL